MSACQIEAWVRACVHACVSSCRYTKGERTYAWRDCQALVEGIAVEPVVGIEEMFRTIRNNEIGRQRLSMLDMSATAGQLGRV